MPFNRLMTKSFECSNMEELIQRMFAHVKTQLENSRNPGCGFTLDKIMLLHMNFHELALTGGSSYIKFPEWIAKSKEGINPKNNDEGFIWAFMTALLYDELGEMHSAYLNCSIMKISITGKGLSFR